MKRNPVQHIILTALLVMAATSALAVDLEGSGFLTVVAGKVLGGDLKGINPSGYGCPCFISDFAQGGVYEGRGIQLGPDTRLGLQGKASFDDRFALTGQVVSRGAANGQADLEWAYADVGLTDALTVQLGRKRLPLFYYSESQDVGFSYPWTHLPPQLYGWEVVNYNGANLRHVGRLGDWATHLNLFAGAESSRDNPYWHLYAGKQTRTDVRWQGIVGAEISISRDWFEGRLVHIETDARYRNVTTGGDWTAKAHNRIDGISLALDPGNWVLRAEALRIDRHQDFGADNATLLGVGYRFGAFLPMITRSAYWQQMASGAPNAVPDGEERHTTTSLTLRWNLSQTRDVKLQYDRWHDHSGPAYATPFGGSSLVTVGYDQVF